MIIYRSHILSQIFKTQIGGKQMLIFSLSEKKKEITPFFKNSLAKSKIAANILTNKAQIIDPIQEKVPNFLTKQSKIVPQPQRDKTFKSKEDASNDTKIDPVEVQKATVKQMKPNCSSKQYEILIKKLTKQQIRREIMYLRSQSKKKYKFDLSKQQKAFYDNTQRRYVELLKEQVRKVIINKSEQLYQVDCRWFRTLLFINQHVEGLHETIKKAMNDNNILSQKFVFITGVADGESIQSIDSRQLRIWCFEKRYQRELDYQRVVDKIKNYSGYLIDFKIVNH